MPSYTEEQKRRALDAVEECGGSVTRAIRKLGYPSRHAMYPWLNQHDAEHEKGGQALKQTERRWPPSCRANAHFESEPATSEPAAQIAGLIPKPRGRNPQHRGSRPSSFA